MSVAVLGEHGWIGVIVLKGRCVGWAWWGYVRAESAF